MSDPTLYFIIAFIYVPRVGNSATIKFNNKKDRGPPRKDYIKQLSEDTGLTRQDLKNCMQERSVWKAIVEVRPSGSP